MVRHFLPVSLFLFSVIVFADGMDDEINSAMQNAKKGITYGLSNLKTKKNKIDNTLIAEDKLVADIKVTKEINGVKIESTGYYNSVSVTVTLYRSYESLVKDKYIDKLPDPPRED